MDLSKVFDTITHSLISQIIFKFFWRTSVDYCKVNRDLHFGLHCTEFAFCI